jgi:S-DNA-T family DNA segregation ATPase FtsK/SpoIIIE
MPEIVVGAPAPAPSKPKKAAPPRPEELARQGGAPPKVVPPAAPRPQSGIPGVIRLTDGQYELPPLHLFESAAAVVNELDRNFVLEQAQRLVAALAEFRIRGKVTKIHPGPVITRYEFKPEAGVKLSKIESLENDIAMALEAVRIRILAPIPGKSTVGFEVPNKVRETVYIKEILATENFGAGNKLPLALGKDITGHVTFTDLAKAPHLLVAGATGSGKSVGVNAMVCSLLYTCSPEDVRMVMIDPKMLELSIYEGIPHLLLPVVTDPEKAALALRWAVQEMERRYCLLSEAQVRDIAGYNRKLPELQAEWDKEKRQLELAAAEVERDAALHGEDGAAGHKLSGTSFDAQGNPHTVTGGQIDMPDRPSKLPYIVVIIDEFADLMMVASKEVEQSVARIAAKARAAGLHLIVATQRPSVDVITGTIKNNFPSRIAFQVTSEVDSRTILDGKGAKQLLGMGDMLHMDRGMQAERVHGCFVSEEEILKVVEFVKRQAKPVYNMDIVRKRDDDGDASDVDENLDPMYDRAVEIVAEVQKVSTSMLQRRLGIGYNRAAKIVEAMEERGVIGPARGTTPREVFVSAA